jgi:hypothetical protein
LINVVENCHTISVRRDNGAVSNGEDGREGHRGAGEEIALGISGDDVDCLVTEHERDGLHESLAVRVKGENGNQVEASGEVGQDDGVALDRGACHGSPVAVDGVGVGVQSNGADVFKLELGTLWVEGALGHSRDLEAVWRRRGWQR